MWDKQKKMGGNEPSSLQEQLQAYGAYGLDYRTNRLEIIIEGRFVCV